MKKLLLILIAVSITLFAGVTLAGDHFGKGFGRCRGTRGHGHYNYMKIMMFQHIMDELDLNENQTDEVESAFKNIHTFLKKKGSDHSSKKEEILSAIKNNDLTEQKIIDHWRSHQEDAEEMVSKAAKEIVRINEVLTDEQREKVAEKLESMHNENEHGLY